jgi:hypothetical protein
VGVALGLLGQARYLATYEAPSHSQPALRRAVSTAYYALFHLLIEDAGQRWQGSPESITGLERGFNHGSMKNASLQFKGSKWVDWHGVEQSVPMELQRVAMAFVELQEDRNLADYNNHETWSVTDVTTVLNTATAAFSQWDFIRTDPMACNYLIAMLLGKQR